MIRESIVERKTNEVEVYVKINIDGEGKYKIDTGIPFFQPHAGAASQTWAV